MLVRSFKDISPVTFGKGVTKRVAIGPKQGAPTFVMRIFELPPGASTPFHAHEWEHELFLISGEGVLIGENKETPLNPDDSIFVPPNEKHCFTNRGKSLMRIICVVPVRGEDTP
jgi:quercetin dioxygenase-like cupin family protein